MDDDAQVDQVAGDGGTTATTPAELKEFLGELTALNQEAESGAWSRRTVNDDTRFCRWSGQSEDGRKHKKDLGHEAHPFEGATDSRCRLADGVVNLKSAILTAAATRAHLRVEGMEITDEGKAGKVKTLLKWVISNQLGRTWWREVKKLTQYMLGDSPAVGILGIWWNREEGLRARIVKPEEIVTALSEAFGIDPESATAEILAAVLDPEREAEAARLLQTLVVGMEAKRARTILAEWRAGRAAEFPEPYVRINVPKVLALRLFVDIFIPSNTGAIEEARVVFHREALSKVQLLARRRTHGYSQTWLKKVLGTEGQTSLQGKTFLPTEAQFASVNGVTQPVSLDAAEPLKGLYEVITAYWPAIRDDGIPGIYRMAFSGGVKDETGTDKELMEYDHGRLPFIDFTREVLTSRLMDSRGIPEVLVTDQSFVKLLDDVYGDHAQLTFPPILTKGKQDRKLLIGPLVQLRQARDGDISWMRLPDLPLTTDVERKTRLARVAEYFGIPHEAVSQILVDVLNQDLVDGFLWAMGDALQMMVQLCQQYLNPQQLQRIVGGQGLGLGQTLEEIQGKFDVALNFDVRTLDPQYVLKLAEAMANWVLPADTSQTIQRDRYVALIAGAINPQLAEAITRPVAEANQAEVSDEQLAFTKIAAGVEPALLDRGQNFRLRLETENQIGQNPEAVGKLSPISLEMLKRRVTHFEFMLTQEKNAQIGRTGVQPVMEELSGAPAGQAGRGQEADGGIPA